jgi:hypothetical protein
MQKVLLAIGVTTLLSVPAMAQTTTEPDTQAPATTTETPSTTTPTTPTETPAPAENSAAPAATTTSDAGTFVAVQPTDNLSSDLIGLDITNSNEEDVGEITDIVVSGDKLAGYIISVGGFLGLGDRYVMVAPSAIQITYAEDDKTWSAKMETTKDQLKAAPEFKYEGRWGK